MQANQISEKETREYRKLLRKTRSEHPAVIVVRAIVEGERPRVEHAEPYCELLRDPSNKRWRERRAAAWALGVADLSPEARDAAVGALTDRLMDRVPRSECEYVALGWGALIGVVAGITVAGFTRDLTAAILTGILGTLIAAIVLIPFVTALRDARHEALRVAATTALGRIGLAESAGWLAVALSDKSRKVRRAAIPALKSALPAITPEHFGRLEGFVVQRLCLALKQRDPELVTAVVEALGKVGDGRALAPMERLRAGVEPPLADRIDDVLPVIRQRAREMYDPRTLLRAAGTPDDSLLRSSDSFVTAADSERLLRSMGGDEEVDPR